MRMIGSITNRQLADKLGNYLYLQNIQNRVQAEDDGSYTIWVFDEDKIPLATSILQRFSKDPFHAEFQRSNEQAQILKIKEQIQNRMSRNRTVDVRTQWHQYDTRLGPVTIVLIGICVVVAIISGLGKNVNILRPLFFTDFQTLEGMIYFPSIWSELAKGEVWRLITPIFIHFGILHLVFNMMWLKDLGSYIERRQSSYYLLALVLVIGILSNFAQFEWGGPSFGGMSGVVYGLLGYMWIRGRFDPASGLSLNPSVVTMMIVWFFLCLTGLIGNVANAAHGAGLGAGMVWGFLAAKVRR